MNECKRTRVRRVEQHRGPSLIAPGNRAPTSQPVVVHSRSDGVTSPWGPTASCGTRVVWLWRGLRDINQSTRCVCACLCVRVIAAYMCKTYAGGLSHGHERNAERRGYMQDKLLSCMYPLLLLHLYWWQWMKILGKVFVALSQVWVQR